MGADGDLTGGLLILAMPPTGAGASPVTARPTFTDINDAKPRTQPSATLSLSASRCKPINNTPGANNSVDAEWFCEHVVPLSPNRIAKHFAGSASREFVSVGVRLPLITSYDRTTMQTRKCRDVNCTLSYVLVIRYAYMNASKRNQ